MSSEHKLWAIVSLCSCIAISAVAWAISYGYVESWRTVTEQGYTQQQMQGTTGTMWIKKDGTPVE